MKLLAYICIFSKYQGKRLVKFVRIQYRKCVAFFFYIKLCKGSAKFTCISWPCDETDAFFGPIHLATLLRWTFESLPNYPLPFLQANRPFPYPKTDTIWNKHFILKLCLHPKISSNRVPYSRKGRQRQSQITMGN